MLCRGFRIRLGGTGLQGRFGCRSTNLARRSAGERLGCRGLLVWRRTFGAITASIAPTAFATSASLRSFFAASESLHFICTFSLTLTHLLS